MAGQAEQRLRDDPSHSVASALAATATPVNAPGRTIAAPDVALPGLNLLSYYIFLFGGLILLTGSLTRGAASFGWYAYAPLNSAIYSPAAGADMFVTGLCYPAWVPSWAR